MDSDTLIMIVGVILSLAFSYFGKLNTWYAGKPADTQRLIMAGLLLAVSLVVFGLACAGLGADFGIPVTCDRAGALALVKTFILAVVSNQATYAISPQTRAVKLTRSKRSMQGYIAPSSAVNPK